MVNIALWKLVIATLSDAIILWQKGKSTLSVPVKVPVNEL
jgi:hypothetical protein